MAKAGDETSMVAIDVQELERSMKKSLQTKGRTIKKKEPCTIYRVFHTFRNDREQDYHSPLVPKRKSKEQDYTPQIIAIGPFHHDNKALKPMEPLKWRYLRQLIRRNQERNTLQKYIDAVSKIKTEARSYYSEPVEADDNAFIEMMVLDGCFLVEFLVKAYFGENEEHLSEVNWNLPLLRNDLLLLENQIPFPVLELLFDSSDIPILLDFNTDGTPVTLMNLVVSYVTRNKFEALPDQILKPEESRSNSIHHLLHALHASLRPSLSTGQECYSHVTAKVRRLSSMATAPLLLILSCFLNCRIPSTCCGSSRGDSKEKQSRAPRGIPTATQLEDSGVEFMRKKGTNSMLDVSFDKVSGIMEIPMLSIQEATVAQFRNLIAFEQCCPTSGTHFTAHATLMNNLIDTAADVAILKDKGIIESKLGEDEEVAQLFNSLCKGSYLNFEKHHLLQLFKDVVEYCNIDRHKWRAGLMHNYFGNPWATISLIAAVFLLCLTVVQTFYTIYAYHHPPSQ